MKILCTISEAADIIRACEGGSCWQCALTRLCNDGGQDKHPEKLMEIVEDVDGDK